MASTLAAHDKYPGIAKAAIEISYDNGGINRDRAEVDMLIDLDGWLENNVSFSEADLIAANQWLCRIPQPILDIVCSGEDSERKVALHGAPACVEPLLTAIFDEVG